MRDLVRAAIGTECILEPAAAGRYHVRGCVPEMVVAPRSAEQAAALLRLASQEGWAVECAGAGSRLSGGNPALRVDIVMTTSALIGVSEYEPADLVITMEAGASITQINALAAQHNQFIALDPPVATTSTLGGTVATGMAGPLRFAHGTPRDQVLGLEFVTGDGKVLHFGGRVVKNVAGYDVVRLLTGSRGTLAFITRVSMRLKPLPEVDRTAVVFRESLAAIAGVADAIMAMRLEPAAIEIVSEPLAHALFGAAGWALLARLHGNPEAVTDGLEQVRAAAGAALVDVVDRQCWSDLATQEAAAAVNIRVANHRTALRDTAAAALHAARQSGCENSRLAIHAGDGIVRMLADALPTDRLSVWTAARDAVAAADGTLTVERMPHQDGIDSFGVLKNATIMAGLKRIFDPAGVLGAGRFAL